MSKIDIQVNEKAVEKLIDKAFEKAVELIKKNADNGLTDTELPAIPNHIDAEFRKKLWQIKGLRITKVYAMSNGGISFRVSISKDPNDLSHVPSNQHLF